jgi:hypothetical protein
MKKKLTKKEKEIIERIDLLIQEYTPTLTDYYHTTQKHCAQSSIDTAEAIKNYILGNEETTEEKTVQETKEISGTNPRGWIKEGESVR